MFRRDIVVFHQPHTFEEALRIRAELGSAVTPLCGGTDLLVAMNRSQWHPAGILDLSRVDGNTAIERRNGHWHIAGGATHTQLSALPLTALARAALSIGGAQIRNRGTLAGNLGTASPAGDACVALLALDATIELVHATRGARQVPASEFFLDYRRTALAEDELIRSVDVAADWHTAWYKIGKRASVNISIICCAVGRSADGRFAVAFGCTGPYPMRAPAAEAVLNQAELTHELIEEAAAAAMREVTPIDDHRASAGYRRAMCGTVLKRLLTEEFLAAG